MFKLTAKQSEAQLVMGGPAKHVMLEGGARSGKTFVEIRGIVARALATPESRHLIARFRLNAVTMSIVNDTFPAVMRLCFPGVRVHFREQKGLYELPDGQQIWIAGLDDKERVEKILGTEFVTIMLNECSQIPWDSRNTVVTRLAQKVICKTTGKPLRPKMYYDMNPPDKGHWTYKLFRRKIDPETGLQVNEPGNYAFLQMNPTDNVENLSEDYIKELKGLSPRLQRRFLLGEYAEDNPNQLFHELDFDKWRVTNGELPEMVRIVIAVDPSGSGDTDNAHNDAIGIAAVGLGIDGNAYVLEDLTVKAGPATWARIACSAFDRYEADKIVAESNYGGAMVEQVIMTARPDTPIQMVRASRGKHVRAEPFSPLYTTGKVRHVGNMHKLEDEMVAFTPNGYTGQGSPNRADAVIWGLAALFPAIVAPRDDKKKIFVPESEVHWMN